MLGRPFGVPGDADFQRKVLLAALELLDRETGPVLEDYPIDAPPDTRSAPEGLACPVSFPQANPDGDLVQLLAHEVAQLAAWHAVAVKHSGRTTLGVSGLTPAEIATLLGAWLRGSAPARYREDLSQGDALKQACDELRAYYYEAKSVQPGEHSSLSMQSWFWRETAAGRALLQIRDIAAKSAEPSVKAVSGMSLIPRAVETMLQQAGNQKTTSA